MTEGQFYKGQEDIEQMILHALMQEEYQYQVEETLEKVATYAIVVSHVDSEEEDDGENNEKMNEKEKLEEEKIELEDNETEEAKEEKKEEVKDDRKEESIEEE